MNWKLVFKIYVEGKGEKKIELTRYKLTTKDDIMFFLKEFFEGQREWQIEERGKGWGFEMVLEDVFGREVPIKNLQELIEEGGELMKIFSMTAEVIEGIIAEGIS